MAQTPVEKIIDKIDERLSFFETCNPEDRFTQGGISNLSQIKGYCERVIIPIEENISADLSDMVNKLTTLNEYCRMFSMGKKVPHELYAVVQECDEYLEDIKS